MLVLGIETSQRAGWVSLSSGDSCLEERRLDSTGRRHAQALPLVASELLAAHQVDPKQLDLLAVSIGPGSFTGLRVGVVFAKTLAWSIGCPVAAVDTLWAVATAAPPDLDRLYVVSDAQRNELFVGLFHRESSSTWSRQGAITIEGADAWCRQIDPSITVTGPALPLIADQLPTSCLQLHLDPSIPLASDVAIIGCQLWHAGQTSDGKTLEPLYLRKSAAEEQRDHQHL